MGIKKYLMDFDSPPTRESEKKDTKLHGDCVVHGCNWEGHFNPGTGWLCRWHDGHAPSQWARITTILRHNEAELAWCEQVATWSSVDFDHAKLQERAPHSLLPGEQEQYLHYKKRMARYARELISFDKYKSAPQNPPRPATASRE